MAAPEQFRAASTQDSAERSRASLVRQLPCIAPPDLPDAMRQIAKEDILEGYASDPWFRNYFVNWWEYAHGETVVSSYPWNITIPIADVCNARCTFCTSWLEGTRVLQLEEIPRFAEILRYAKLLGIAGHGEPLAHPHCDEIFEAISSYMDPRCESYVITNGVFLEERRQSLERLNVRTYNISLNAASPEMHNVVMGLGSAGFETVVSSIGDLVRKRRQQASDRIHVNISFVLTRDNVHETAAFVRLGNELGVDNIYLRTLNAQAYLPAGLNYHLLPPYLHPQFDKHMAAAKEAIAGSKVNIITDVASWAAPVIPQSVSDLVEIQKPEIFDRNTALKDLRVRGHYSNYYQDVRGAGQPLPESEPNVDIYEDGTDPFGRRPPYHCYFVYHDFIINDFNLRLLPCCYMSHVPGFELIKFDGSRPFMEFWNSPAFVTLRTRLREGPLFGACKKCPAQNL